MHQVRHVLFFKKIVRLKFIISLLIAHFIINWLNYNIKCNILRYSYKAKQWKRDNKIRISRFAFGKSNGAIKRGMNSQSAFSLSFSMERANRYYAVWSSNEKRFHSPLFSSLLVKRSIAVARDRNKRSLCIKSNNKVLDLKTNTIAKYKLQK